MGIEERSLSSGRTDWPVRIARGVGGGLGAVAGFFLSRLVIHLSGIEGFWPGAIGASVGGGLGVYLGQIAGARVFRLFRRPTT